MSNTVEVEIKVLLGELQNAQTLISKIQKNGYKLETQNSQLNHYFVGKNFPNLLQALEKNTFVDSNSYTKLQKILSTDQANFSLRTRQLDKHVFVVVKASLDQTSSQNGTARLEFEEQVDLSLIELDEILIQAGFQFQAKWSRDRKQYSKPETDIKICLDKNAGYGYLAEFEKIMTLEDNKLESIELAKEELRKLVQSFDLLELEQIKLAKMFEYYNQNWQNYYGTEKVFDIAKV